jgi:hypothetical protein
MHLHPYHQLRVPSIKSQSIKNIPFKLLLQSGFWSTSACLDAIGMVQKEWLRLRPDKPKWGNFSPFSYLFRNGVKFPHSANLFSCMYNGVGRQYWWGASYVPMRSLSLLGIGNAWIPVRSSSSLSSACGKTLSHQLSSLLSQSSFYYGWTTSPFLCKHIDLRLRPLWQ